MPGPRPADPDPVHAFRAEFTCALDCVRPAVESAIAFLARQSCAPEDLSACELALIEAGNNAVRHATRPQQTQPVRLELLCNPSTIEMRITDHTSGFNWPENAELPPPGQEGGRGLFLISSLMREARYLRGREENVLVLRRQRLEIVETSADSPELPADLATCRRHLQQSEQVVGELIEELSSCYESLSAIFRFGAEQARTGELEDFAARLLKDMLQILQADWFLVRLLSDSGARLEVFVASDPAPEWAPLFLPEEASEATSLETRVATREEEAWFGQYQPLGDKDPLAGFGPDSNGLVHPLILGGKLIGTLAVGKTTTTQPTKHSCSPARVTFTAGQTSVISTFGDFLAIQLVNARFQEQLVTSRVLARELEIARTIQRSLLPQAIPQVAGFNLAASCENAHNVGGDFYDVLPLGQDRLLLVIADVMGKGVPAAMFAAILRTLIRASLDQAEDPAGLLARWNRVLFQDLSAVDMFITVQLALLDAPQRRLTVASAGHCPLLVVVPDEGEVQAVAPEGMPLGILPETGFANAVQCLPPRGRALLYTDGLTELLNHAGDRFRPERLTAWLRRADPAQGAEALRDALRAELLGFGRNGPPQDDQTFLILTG